MSFKTDSVTSSNVFFFNQCCCPPETVTVAHCKANLFPHQWLTWLFVPASFLKHFILFVMTGSSKTVRAVKLTEHLSNVSERTMILMYLPSDRDARIKRQRQTEPDTNIPVPTEVEYSGLALCRDLHIFASKREASSKEGINYHYYQNAERVRSPPPVLLYYFFINV